MSGLSAHVVQYMGRRVGSGHGCLVHDPTQINMGRVTLALDPTHGSEILPVTHDPTGSGRVDPRVDLTHLHP